MSSLATEYPHACEKFGFEKGGLVTKLPVLSAAGDTLQPAWAAVAARTRHLPAG